MADPVIGSEKINRIGYEFVKQYYDMRVKNTEQVHRFYNTESSMLSIGDEGDSTVAFEPVKGQRQIHKKIVSLDQRFRNVTISTVDCQSGPPPTSILIQVIGTVDFEDTKSSAQSSRKFCQLFCLDEDMKNAQGKPIMAIRNDIFRFLKADPAAEDAEISGADGDAAAAPSAAAVPPAVVPTPVEPPTEQPAAEPAVKPAPQPAAVPEPEESAAPEPAPAADVKPAESAASPPAAAEPEVPSGPPKQLTYAERLAQSKANPKPASAPAARKPAAPAPALAKPVAKVAPKPGLSTRPPRDGPLPRCPHPEKPGCSVYVRNVPQGCSVDDLVRTFERVGPIRDDPKYGPCVSIQNMKNPPKNSNHPVTRYAFVEFSQPTSLQKCLSPEYIKSFSIAGGPGEPDHKLIIEERVPRTAQGPRRDAGGRGRGRGRGGRR